MHGKHFHFIGFDGTAAYVGLTNLQMIEFQCLGPDDWMMPNAPI